MILTLPRPIPKKRVPWENQDHLFNPENITKYEFICSRINNCPYRKVVTKTTPRALRCGQVVWLMRDGKVLDFTPLEPVDEEKEIEDRSGEPTEL